MNITLNKLQQGIKHSLAIAFVSSLLFSPALYAQEQKTDVSTEAVLDPKSANLEERFTGEKKPSPPDLAYAEFQRGNYLSAFAVALPLAEAGNAPAQTLIAELYEKGLGITLDTKQAAIWYGIAAQAGNREAQFAYSVKLMQGQDIERNTELGVEMLRKAADSGHPIANYNYANYIIDQRPTSAGYRQALPYFEKAAEHRLGDAFYSLSQIYIQGLTDGIQRPEKGREWLIRAARAGIDTAQMDLAIALIRGEGGKKDEKSAFNWFLTAARQGNVIAQNRLAHLYWQGVGTEQSSVEAAKWHILAHRAGRVDPSLDRFVELLDVETRNRALVLANRWPSSS